MSYFSFIISGITAFTELGGMLSLKSRGKMDIWNALAFALLIFFAQAFENFFFAFYLFLNLAFRIVFMSTVSFFFLTYFFIN